MAQNLLRQRLTRIGTLYIDRAPYPSDISICMSAPEVWLEGPAKTIVSSYFIPTISVN